MRRILIALCVPFLLMACSARQVQEPPFAPVLEKHLAAIQNHDLDSYLATISQDADLNVVFPGGRLAKSRDDVVAFYKNWFAQTNWSFEQEQVKLIKRPGLRVVLLRTHYKQPQPIGPLYEVYALRSLVFGLEDGNWRLLHDHNTQVPEAYRSDWKAK